MTTKPNDDGPAFPTTQENGANCGEPGMTNITIPLEVANAASEALGNFVSDHGWSDSDMQAMDNLDAYIARHRANQAARAELAKPAEASYTATQLAAMVLSDCGISTNHTSLHERVAARITRHEDDLIDRLKKLAKPVTDVVVTKNKSGQIVAVTLQDEDGRVMEVIDESTPTPAWHDAPTEPGLWVCNYGMLEVAHVHQADVDNFDPVYNAGGRWCGPLPQDSMEGEKS